MSQVTEQSVRFQTALASIKLIQASAVLDLTEDDFDFLTSNKVWIRKPPLPALTVKLSKYNVDDVALGVCKTGAEEAGVTEVRTSLSEKKFELWREIKV